MLIEPVTRMRRLWPISFLLTMPLFALGVTTPDARPTASAISERDHQLSRMLIRESQFAEVPHINVQPACADSQPPEALTTPNPLFAAATHGRKVRVSFIIGVDGRVHAPLILESAGVSGDRRALDTVRTWRYRPATCNGVPTEIEGKIEFSSR